MDSTVGGDSADSYVDVLYADSYAASVVGYEGVWPTDEATKESALIHATRLIDASFDWYGSKDTDTQSLDWPRDGVYDKNNILIEDDIIPKAVKDATCQLALNILLSGGVNKPSQTAEQIHVGPIRLTLDTDKETGVFDSIILTSLSFLGDFSFSRRGKVSFSKVIRS